MQFLAAYIMKGRIQAMTVAAALALLSLAFSPISIVSSASVALVTLRRGAKEGLYVLLCACLAAAVLSVILKIGYEFALLYGLVLWLPIWGISVVLREGRQLGVAIEIAVLLGVVAVLVFYLYQPHPAQIWTAFWAEIMRPALEGHVGDMSVEQVKQVIHNAARFTTGAAAAGAVFGLLLGLFLARWWQAALYNPGGFRTEFLELRAHVKLTLATVVVFGIAMLSSGVLREICWNLLWVLCVLYLLVGIAVLHASFAAMKGGRFMVPFLYLTLVLVPHMVLLVAIWGLLDNWLNLRPKISNSTAE